MLSKKDSTINCIKHIKPVLPWPISYEYSKVSKSTLGQFVLLWRVWDVAICLYLRVCLLISAKFHEGLSQLIPCQACNLYASLALHTFVQYYAVSDEMLSNGRLLFTHNRDLYFPRSPWIPIDTVKSISQSPEKPKDLKDNERAENMPRSI